MDGISGNIYNSFYRVAEVFLCGKEEVLWSDISRDNLLDSLPNRLSKLDVSQNGELVELYVNTLNLIHYMHDKYYYEAAEMALIDTYTRRTFATGIAGFSHVVDSISAIKYAKVKTIRDDAGLIVDYEIEGDFPRYGNDDERADEIAIWLLKAFMKKVREHHTYRNSEPTTSILTITSNVVYGKATGATPDGRKAGAPFAPGANPAYGAEKNGLLASLNSVAKLPYEFALDGISNTQTISPGALGHSEAERVIMPLVDEDKRSLVRYAAVDATNYESLEAALDGADGPICVTTEGLVMYFNDSEAAQLCGNIRRLLSFLQKYLNI